MKKTTALTVLLLLTAACLYAQPGKPTPQPSGAPQPTPEQLRAVKPEKIAVPAAPDPFGVLLGCGVTFLIGLQAFINIGVVTSALPNKGLPLPFISYGGSNLLAMFTCVGLLFSIARFSRPPAEAPESLNSSELPQPA